LKLQIRDCGLALILCNARHLRSRSLTIKAGTPVQWRPCLPKALSAQPELFPLKGGQLERLSNRA
jgi:hypothetical protein